MTKSVCRLWLSLPVLALAASCNDATDEPERSTCDLAGVWALAESAAEGSCEDRALAVAGGELRIEDQGGMYAFKYYAPGMTALDCSGTPQGDACRLELTCSGAESGAEVAFEIEVDPEQDRLKGLRRLQLRDPSCQTTYELTGEREVQSSAF